MKYITQHPIKKSDLGFHGNLFGGKLLAWFICVWMEIEQMEKNKTILVSTICIT